MSAGYLPAGYARAPISRTHTLLIHRRSEIGRAHV